MIASLATLSMFSLAVAWDWAVATSVPSAAYCSAAFLCWPQKSWRKYGFLALIAGAVCGGALAALTSATAWTIAERAMTLAFIGLVAVQPLLLPEMEGNLTRLLSDSWGSGPPTTRPSAGASLCDRLRACGAFDASELAAIDAALQSAPRGESKSQAQQLVSCGLLTQFQADMLRTRHEARLRFADYTLLDTLGHGGSGTVFHAQHVVTKLNVALKILRARNLADRFEREMEAVQKLAHPHIVIAYDVGAIGATKYIAMELIRGKTINDLVCDDGPLPAEQALRFITQAAAGLEHAHRRGLLHRDIKPGNLLLADNGEIKIADLGLARFVNQSPEHKEFETEIGMVAGTIEFMAPEQAWALADADARSDIYSLGCTLFFMLTGKPLLLGDRFKTKLQNLTGMRRFRDIRAAGLPERETAILQKMVEYKREDRYQSCSEVLQAWRDCLSRQDTAPADTSVEVLVVEDSRIDLIATLRLLRKANTSVNTHTVGSVREAEEACGNQRLDLILLDLHLPDSQGAETVRRIQAVNRCGAPIVVLTGESDEVVESECRELGAAAFLNKDELSVETIERRIFVTLSQQRGRAAE